MRLIRKATMLAVERLREVLDYDPDTGVFTRKRVFSNRSKLGGVAGSTHSVSVDSKTYEPARLAWFYMKGEWPSCEVVHLDWDMANNRFSNLALRSSMAPTPDAELTPDMVRAVLEYDPGSGLFRWKSPAIRRVKIGDVAGSINKKGYRYIRVNGKPRRAHILAWMYVYGRKPVHQIDHIDQDKDNNRIANLREATNKQNQGNIKIHRHNTSGVRGVGWDKRRRKWCAQIKINGKFTHLGSFDVIEDAAEAYRAAARRHFGDDFVSQL